MKLDADLVRHAHQTLKGELFLSTCHILPTSLWKHYVKPFLFSIELGPPTRCALVSLLNSCSAFHTLWEEHASARELIIVHDHYAIEFRGRICPSDFQTYISAALRATVVHPCRLVLRDISCISWFNDLQQQVVPNIVSQNSASVTIAVDFVFERENIGSYLHSMHMHIPQLISTRHWLYATCDGIEFALLDVCVAICDVRDEGDHALFAVAPWEYEEPEMFPTTRFAYAKKFARTTSLFFGLWSVTDHQRSSIAVEWSEERWPPSWITEYAPSFSTDPCVEAAIRKADQEGTDVVVSALV